MDEQHLVLNTGAPMPVVGLGTWKSPPDKAGEAVEYALTKCGYTHIDCAWIYGNQKEIGASFKKVFDGGSVKRDGVFITSKLWNSFHAKKDVATACTETLDELELDYLDLYLIHWGLATPLGENEPIDENGTLVTSNVPIRETWEAMQELVRKGLVKAIGVSNFTCPMLTDLLSYASIPPASNQIELHPYLQQTPLVEFCRYKKIAVIAYSPLGRPGAEPPRSYMHGQDAGKRIVDDPVIGSIASSHNKTPAQILLRWGIERGTAVIPKSVTPTRIRENSDVYDFQLSEADMRAIAALDRGLRLCNPIEWWGIPYF